MKTWIFFLAAFAAVSNATSVNLNQEREASINTPIEGLEKRCRGSRALPTLIAAAALAVSLPGAVLVLKLKPRLFRVKSSTRTELVALTLWAIFGYYYVVVLG
ncbi:hypothetical protein AnigIFM63604_011040 [Aspergillus niger]|uniref:Uncharacterized protein n=1 Tax=Aspergillus niger TaxID=5061 RepID=A0A9W6ECB6_ASPNG|nr:hypothetical protein AnigIFM63604_011040 [Aspergillus niger]